jgi:tRNA-dihydrouridine synthase A
MLEPTRVADCVAAMRARVSIPVTVKMRIGVVSSRAQARGRNSSAGSGQRLSIREAVATFDESDYAALSDFLRCVRDAGCQVAIVHARKAVLGGLSPKDNREIPPLRFDVVRRIKQSFPDLPVVLNGGIREAASALDTLAWCDGVMLGREAYHRPFVLRELEEALYPDCPLGHSTREQMLERMACYAEAELARGGRLAAITRHMLGLYGGQPGAREYRRFLSEGSRSADAGPDLIRRAGTQAHSRFTAVAACG